MGRVLLYSTLAAIILLPGLSGCEKRETNKDVLSRYAEVISRKREALTRIASLLPPVGALAAGEKCPPLDPPLAARTDVAGQPASPNADWMMFDRLSEQVRNDLNPREFELQLDSALLDAVMLADPTSRDYCGDSRENVDEHARAFEAATQVRYVVVVRMLEHEKATVVKGDDADAPIRYTNGRAAFECFVCDLETPRILCGYRAVAVPSRSDATVSVVKGSSAALRLETELRNELVAEVRKQIIAGLAQAIGA